MGIEAVVELDTLPEVALAAAEVRERLLWFVGEVVSELVRRTETQMDALPEQPGSRAAPEEVFTTLGTRSGDQLRVALLESAALRRRQHFTVICPPPEASRNRRQQVASTAAAPRPGARR